MTTLLSATFKPQEVTKADLAIASIAWGFTLGFGFLTTWTAIQQTAQIRGRYGISKLNSPYVWMIWLEILVCLCFSVICWLHLWDYIPPSFAFYFTILTLWALQVQFLLQIIINRVAIISTDRHRALYLKVGVAILITSINISVYTIWVPARLQISEAYIHLNDIWDRCEKCIYLVVDGLLNWYFIYIVKQRLVKKGLSKYDKLVRFNMWIIGLSLSMDCLIIGMMSLSNSFVYMQFHPLAYIVKLNIEMSMANLIAKVSSSPSHASTRPSRPRSIHPRDTSTTLGHHHRRTASSIRSKASLPKEAQWDSHELYSPSEEIAMKDMFEPRGIEVTMEREVTVQVEKRTSEGDSSGVGYGVGFGVGAEGDDDGRPLKEEASRENAMRTGVGEGMGSFTKVWA